MRTVSLYRHAKSSWDDPALEDFERGLSKRGQKSAPAMGAFLRDNALMPELVICSPAQRTRETFDLTFGQRNDAPGNLRCDERLYHASSATMLDLLRNLPAEVGHVMILGHNPGLHALALDLFSHGAADAVDTVCRKFPTCGLAVVDIELGEWRSLGVGEGLPALVHDAQTAARAGPRPGVSRAIELRRDLQTVIVSAMITLIDNYDSFTYNLVHYFADLGVSCRVYRNDKIGVDAVMSESPGAIVLSPGPCDPDRAGHLS